VPFGWGIVSTGTHPDVKIAPAMAAAGGGELVGVYSRDQARAEAFAQKHGARAAYSQLGEFLKALRRLADSGVSGCKGVRGARDRCGSLGSVGKSLACASIQCWSLADALG
jgi:hypothetical protein